MSAVPAPVPAGVQVAGVQTQGIPAGGVGTTVLFDRPGTVFCVQSDLILDLCYKGQYTRFILIWTRLLFHVLWFNLE